MGRLAEHYEQEASHQASAARNWLYGVALATVSLAAVVVWLIVENHTLPDNADWEMIGAMLATKALALGVLSYVVSFCAKNYRSHRHLHATYRQRMSALDTYSLMALSLRDDPDDRRLVLQELAKSVFSPSDTGLTGSGSSEKTVIENMPVFSAVRPGG